MRSAGLIESGSASMLDCPLGAGARGAAGLRGIEPVTSGILAEGEGLKNSEPRLVELVESGSPSVGAACGSSGAGVADGSCGAGTLGVVAGACAFGSIG